MLEHLKKIKGLVKEFAFFHQALFIKEIGVKTNHMASVLFILVIMR